VQLALVKPPSVYNLCTSTARYIRRQDGETWLGYFEQLTDTQGELLSDLEDNLHDLYRALTTGILQASAASPTLSWNEAD